MPEAFGALTKGVWDAAKFIRDTLVQKRMREEAEVRELLDPIHEAFLRLHANYIGMFNRLASDIHRLQDRPAAEHGERLKTALSRFYKARVDVEGVRDTFRAQIAGMLAQTRDEAWALYLTAIATYAIQLDNDRIGKDVSTIEMLRNSLANRDGYSVYSTPSAALLRDLRDVADPETALRLINERVALLTFKQVTVFHCYYAIKIRAH